MKSEVEARIEDRYAGGMQALVRVGDIWVIAGVPDQWLRSARTVGSWREYGDVWAPGDSRDCWCPPGVAAEDALARARGPALRAWLADGGGSVR